MEIYFIPASAPELKVLPREERDRVWLLAKRSALKRSWRVWFGIAIVAVIAGGGVHLGSLFGWPYLGAVLGACVGTLLFQPILIHASLPYVRELMRKP